MVADPFRRGQLSQIFKQSPINKDRLISRESTWLEFKQSFTTQNLAEYARTMAAFANTGGGYLVFGVKDSPHLLLGLTNTKFEETDPSTITQYLNDTFSPEIKWDSYTHELQGHTFGIIYSHESTHKPVVATKHVAKINEADVFYRYRGRTERIRYPEFRQLLDDLMHQERNRWLRTVENIARIGPEKAAIVDLQSGRMESEYGKLIVDAELLENLNVFYEGRFTESDDSNAIFRIAGELQPISGQSILPVRTEHKSIHSYDIVSDFLNQNRVDNPIEYVRQIAFESSHWYPVYFYIEQTRRTVGEIVADIEALPTHSPTKLKLLDRLRTASEIQPIGSISTDSAAATKKREFIQAVAAKAVNVPRIPPADLRYFFEAISHMGVQDFDKDYLFALLGEIVLPNYSKIQKTTATAMRKALCYVDILLFAGEELES